MNAILAELCPERAVGLKTEDNATLIIEVVLRLDGADDAPRCEPHAKSAKAEPVPTSRQLPLMFKALGAGEGDESTGAPSASSSSLGAITGMLRRIQPPPTQRGSTAAQA